MVTWICCKLYPMQHRKCDGKTHPVCPVPPLTGGCFGWHGAGDAAPERSRQQDAQIDDRRPAAAQNPAYRRDCTKKGSDEYVRSFFVSVCPGSPSYPGQHGGKRRTHIA